MYKFEYNQAGAKDLTAISSNRVAAPQNAPRKHEDYVREYPEGLDFVV
jgi:hypothetical protein